MVGGRGGSAKSDFISKGSLIKRLMRGRGVKKGQNSSDVIYGWPLSQKEILIHSEQKEWDAKRKWGLFQSLSFRQENKLILL